MMFCPKCRSEYDPGFYKCNDCGTVLVSVLPLSVGNAPAASVQNESETPDSLVTLAMKSDSQVASQQDNTVLPDHQPNERFSAIISLIYGHAITLFVMVMITIHLGTDHVISLDLFFSVFFLPVIQFIYIIPISRYYTMKKMDIAQRTLWLGVAASTILCMAILLYCCSGDSSSGMSGLIGL